MENHKDRTDHKDHVSIINPAIDPSKQTKTCKSPRINVSNIKLIISIFILFIIVVSDAFVSGVLSKLGKKTVVGRTPTSWGVCLQGIFLVIGYMIAIYLTEHQIL